MRRIVCVPLLAAVVLLSLVGYSTSSGISPILRESAEEIAADVGQVLMVREGSGEGVIFIFEERHDSCLIQVEIAIMLNRLYSNYGLRHIGREGLMETEGSLDLSWAHRPPPYRPGQPITCREDAIVQTLIDGEITSPEMMGLIYDDMVIDGIDDEELYAADVPAKVWVVPYEYLYCIALAGMSKVEGTAWDALYEKEEYDDAFEFAISTDPFCADRLARFDDAVDIISAEEMLEMLDELEQQAANVRARLPSGGEANLELLRAQLGIISQRSKVLVTNMLKLVRDFGEAPLAMSIGAMHTQRVAELFTEAGVSFVVLRSQAQAEGNTAGLLSRWAYRRKEEGLSVVPDGWLGSLLDGRKNPRPVADKLWYKREEVIRELAQRLTQYAEEVKAEGVSDEETTLELNSFLNLNYLGDLGHFPYAFANREYLAELGIADIRVTGVSSADLVPGLYGIVGAGIALVEFEVDLTEGRSGQPHKIKITVLQYGGEKAGVELSERLSRAKEDLQEKDTPTPETESGAQASPQLYTSNTLSIFQVAA